MNKFIVPGIIVIAVIAIITVIFISQNKPTPKPQLQQQATQPTKEVQKAAPLSITLSMAAQNNSGESGTATLTAIENGKTRVELKLNGAPQDIVQPSHIHTGSCANLGAIVYPLTSPINGVAETILDVDLTTDILNKLPLALNVHKSVSEAGIYVSCGDIINGTSGSTVSSQITPSVTWDDRRGGGGTFQTPDDRRRGADKPEN